MFSSKAQADTKATALPDMKPYEHKKVMVRLEGNRRVVGVLSGYDHFMNLTLRNATEERAATAAGGDASAAPSATMSTCIIRGASVLNIEAVE